MSNFRPRALSLRAGGLGLLVALLGQVDVAPAGEEVLQVPFALAVADEDEGSGHDCFLSIEQVIARSGEAEHVAHRIEAGLAAVRPERRPHRAAREDRAVLGMVRQRDALARAGQDDRMVADDRAAAQRGKADRACRPRARCGRRGPARCVRRGRCRGPSPPPRRAAARCPRARRPCAGGASPGSRCRNRRPAARAPPARPGRRAG